MPGGATISMQAGFKLAAIAAIMGIGSVAAVTPLTLPSADDAKAAIVTMFGDSALAASLKGGHVKLGTCKKASKGQHPGEIACTVAVVMGAGSSETQANFYRAGGKWVATPTEEDLPFPDPKLM